MTATAFPLAASTLGAVEESLEEMVATFLRHGAYAVELRTADDAPVHTGLSADARTRLAEILGAAGIEVLAVASRVRIAADGEDEGIVTDLADHLHLAKDLGARFVRVFPGAPAAPAEADQLPQLADGHAAERRAVARLARVQDLIAETGVRVLVETHDSHPRGADVARLLHLLAEVVPDHRVGAIWDVLHPWRVGEPLSETARYLMPHLVQGHGYVQIKDVPSRQDRTPVLQGTGAVPLGELMGLLRTGGYAGPLSLEWERHWQRSIEPLEEALAAAAAALREHQ